MENKYIARLQDEKIKELMNDFTAILIRGPKWCGKSTTALHFAKSYIKLNTKKQREKFDEMYHQLEIAIHQFAKRQMTWFRGMERRGFQIHWIDAEAPLNENVERIIDLIK